MGFTPATGTEISMGCVYGAFGLTPSPGANIGLNSTLGVNRQPPQAAGVSAIPASGETELSVDMGGLDTPQVYNCTTLVAYFSNTSFSGFTNSGDPNNPEDACRNAGFAGNLYFTSPGPLDWLAATGYTIYSNPQLTTVFNGNNLWYKDGFSQCSYTFQINSSGVIINTYDCYQTC